MVFYILKSYIVRPNTTIELIIVCCAKVQQKKYQELCPIV